MQVAGVGNGVQTCNWELVIETAVPIENGPPELLTWTAPIVEGLGEDLPGLLGMDSLKLNRAIIDIEGKRLIYPGEGKVEWKFPPGTRVIPLIDSPSGHLCVPIDCYDGLVPPTVITPPRALVATEASSSISRGIQFLEPQVVTEGTPARPTHVGWMQAGTPTALPEGLQHSRALVVEEHPIISNLFACQGFQVDTLHPAVVPGPQCAATCGDIRKQKYKAVWLTLPAKTRTGMRSKYCSTIVAWFRAAAAIGIAATLCAPRGERWIHEDIRMLTADGIGKETRHDLCSAAELFSPTLFWSCFPPGDIRGPIPPTPNEII